MAKKTETFNHINSDRCHPFCLERIDSICSGYMLTETPLEKEICKKGKSSLPSETTDCKQMQQDMEPISTSIDNIEVMDDNTMIKDENLDNKDDNVWSTQTNNGDGLCIGYTVITVILICLLLVLYIYIYNDNE